MTSAPDVWKPRTAFFGTPAFAVPVLAALADVAEVPVVVTQPDRPAGRGHRLRAPPVKAEAAGRDIPVLQPVSLKREGASFIEALSAFGPFDGAVVAAFGQILPRGLLAFFGDRCVNVHASLLPRWRGAAPVQRAILAGDSVTGVCLMKMEAGLDTGPVFDRREVPVTDDVSAGRLLTLLSESGASLLRGRLAGILGGQVAAVPQPVDGVTYAPKLTSDEALVDWNGDAAAASRTIRAFDPAPGAFTTVGGKRLKLFGAGPSGDGTPGAADAAGPGGPAGRVIGIAADGGIVVACGRGTITLREVQLEGRGRTDAASFVRGRPGLAPGPSQQERLGGLP